MINQIFTGECLQVMKNFPEKTIDLTVTSPPYDNLRTYNGYTFNFEGIASELYRITKDGGVVVWVVGDATINGSETGTSFKQALYFKEIGFNLHDTMIWEKNTFSSPFPNRYHQVFEYMFVLSKGKPKFNPIEDRKNRCVGEKRIITIREADGSLHRRSSKIIKEYGKRFNVWKMATAKNEHPAPFPEKLAEDHILSWSNEGDIILDPMAGSGTTLKMAKKNNRNYIGIEISKEYVEIINKRLADI